MCFFFRWALRTCWGSSAKRIQEPNNFFIVFYIMCKLILWVLYLKVCERKWHWIRKHHVNEESFVNKRFILSYLRCINFIVRHNCFVNSWACWYLWQCNAIFNDLGLIRDAAITITVIEDEINVKTMERNANLLFPEFSDF